MKFDVYALISMQIQNQGDQYNLDWNIANDQFQNQNDFVKHLSVENHDMVQFTEDPSSIFG